MASAAARKQAPVAVQRDAIVFVSDPESREVIAQAMRDANLPGAKIVDGGIAAALKQSELMPRFLLVDVSMSSTPVQDVAALAAVMEPGTKLIVIGAANDVALYRDLLGVGAGRAPHERANGPRPAVSDPVRAARARAKGPRSAVSDQARALRLRRSR